MTTEETPPTTQSELQTELVTILRQAYENEVEVQGGWECRNGHEHPDWDVLVTEVQKPEPSE